MGRCTRSPIQSRIVFNRLDEHHTLEQSVYESMQRIACSNLLLVTTDNDPHLHSCCTCRCQCFNSKHSMRCQVLIPADICTCLVLFNCSDSVSQNNVNEHTLAPITCVRTFEALRWPHVLLHHSPGTPKPFSFAALPARIEAGTRAA